jgi:hypothetical protein
MEPLEPLSYTGIPPDHIRLLRVDTDESNPDAGSLEVVSLDKAPPFYALSHSWGTQTEVCPVQIDGCVLHLTPGLTSGLQVLQRLAANDSSFNPPLRYIWIDSICVDQKSIADRSSQVALMRKIYSTSIKTLIWLGPQLIWAESAWQLVDQIYNLFESQHAASKIEVDIPVGIYSNAFHIDTKLPAWTDPRWNHLKLLMDLKWFSRIWVVQEVVLSPQDPIILHGERLYPWHRLQWASAWLRRTGYMRLPHIPEKLLNVSNMGNLRHCRTKWPLDALMSFTITKFHATDQRDKIFGLLGIAAECQDASQIPEALRPDYSIDLAQTYLKVARFLLKNGCSLAILTRAHGATGCTMRKQRIKDFAELPSWTPNWSDFRVFNKGIRTSLARAHFSDPEKPPRLGFSQHHAASAELELKLHDTEDISVLRVAGVRLGTITQVHCFDENEASKDDFEHVIESKLRVVWNKFVSELEITDLASWATRFIKATTAERYDLTHRSWEQTLKDGMAYLVHLLQNKDAKMILPSVEGDGQQQIEVLRELSISGEPKKYATLAYTYCFNRCFIVTSTGNIGIGPSDTQVGDYAAVIFGGDIPYVLRENGSSWYFIGELYLEGWMNGEVAREMEKGTLKEEVLSIR